MIVLAASLAGWAAAAVALVAMLLARRAHAGRLDSVAEACHELRGPLAAVALGLALGGRQGSLPAPRLRAMELELGRAALALDDLEAPRRPAPGRGGSDLVHVRELLADSVEACRPGAAPRGAELRLRWSGPEALVPGDRLRLAQALGNLIHNAIEHGGGVVEVSGCAGPGGVRVEILDHGPGLLAPLAELIRRPRANRRHGSTDRHGHGLRIAHSIAAAHGGRLTAAPADGGARLVLELPASPERASLTTTATS
jgi:signal transduction histidine kinase